MRLAWLLRILGRELGEAIVDLLADEIALLHPAFDTGGSTDFRKTAIAIDDFDPIAIFHQSNLVIDGGDAVAQVDLRRGNVADFKDASATTIAGAEQQGSEKNNQDEARQAL